MADLIKQYEEELRAEVCEFNAFVDGIKASGEDFSDEQNLKFCDYQNSIEAKKKKLQTQKNFEAAKTLAAASAPKSESFSNSGSKIYGVTDKDRALAFQAWSLYHLKGGRGEITRQHREAVEKCGFDLSADRCYSFDQTVGTANQGGNLLDGSIYQGMVERTKEIGGVESLATVVTTQNDAPIHWAVTDNTSRTLTKITELGQATNTAVTWDKVTIGAYRYTTGVFPISHSFVRSFPGSVQSYFSGVLTDTYVRSKNDILTNGDGSGDPQGLLVGLTVGETCAAQTDIDEDELDNLISSVDPSYYSDAVFSMNRKTLSYFANLRTENGVAIYPEAANAAAPYLRGFKVVYNPDMPDMGAGTKPIIFGSIKSAFVVRNVGTVEIDASPYQYWLEQALATALWGSFSSAVVNAWAAKTLQMDS